MEWAVTLVRAKCESGLDILAAWVEQLTLIFETTVFFLSKIGLKYQSFRTAMRIKLNKKNNTWHDYQDSAGIQLLLLGRFQSEAAFS